MNEYMKPDYEVMVFEANEYVTACDPTDRFDITLGCVQGGGSITAIGEWNQGSESNAYGGSSYYQFQSGGSGTQASGAGGQLILDFNNGKDENNDGYYDVYAFQGSIMNGHDSNQDDSDGFPWTEGEFGKDKNNTECSICGYNLSYYKHHHVNYVVNHQIFVNRSN